MNIERECARLFFNPQAIEGYEFIFLSMVFLRKRLPPWCIHHIQDFLLGCRPSTHLYVRT